MEDSAIQSEAVPPACGPVRPSDGISSSAANQPTPPNELALDSGRDYPTPPPRRVFFVQGRYRYLGPGEPLPLPPEALDDPT